MPEIKLFKIPTVTKRGVRLIAIEYGYKCAYPKCPKAWDTEEEAHDCYISHEEVAQFGVYWSHKHGDILVYALAEKIAHNSKLSYAVILQRYGRKDGFHSQMNMKRNEIGELVRDFPIAPPTMKTELLGKKINLFRDGNGYTYTTNYTERISPNGEQLLQLAYDGKLINAYIVYNQIEQALAKSPKFTVGTTFQVEESSNVSYIEIKGVSKFVTLTGQIVYETLTLKEGQNKFAGIKRFALEGELEQYSVIDNIT